MGLLSWWRGEKAVVTEPTQNGNPKPDKSDRNSATEIPGMYGAMQVPRPTEATVFEFGSATATADRVTLAGYCPVSDDLQPCRWEIIPSTSDDAPQFRVVF